MPRSRQWRKLTMTRHPECPNGKFSRSTQLLCIWLRVAATVMGVQVHSDELAIPPLNFVVQGKRYRAKDD